MSNTKLVVYSINNGATWDEWMMDERMDYAEMVSAITNHYNVSSEDVKIK